MRVVTAWLFHAQSTSTVISGGGVGGSLTGSTIPGLVRNNHYGLFF